jgi:hypothetical protein
MRPRWCRLCPRRQLSGAPLPPELPHVADAVAAGDIGEDHLRVIGRAIDELPSCVSVADRDDVERSLVASAPEINHAHHPEELLHGNTDPPENDEE